MAEEEDPRNGLYELIIPHPQAAAQYHVEFNGDEACRYWRCKVTGRSKHKKMPVTLFFERYKKKGE